MRIPHKRKTAEAATRVISEGDPALRPDTCHMATGGTCLSPRAFADGIGEGFTFELSRCLVCGRTKEMREVQS